jgi:outer membrane protein OmpA-like peptidoglycan-associated protein
MKKLYLVILLSANLGVQADDLPFPRSEAEIIQALPAPQVDLLNCPPMIPNCELKGLEEKGILEIVNDYPELPKVGALIQFDYDSASIRSYSILKHYGNALKGALKDAIIVVAGHTDYLGSEAYNQSLSERRAQAVKNFLVSIYKIEPTRLRTIGFGETQPLRGNRHFQSDADREWNRRVEFIRLN